MKLFILIFAIALIPNWLLAKDKSLLKVGKIAPDFTLVSEKGDTINLSSFRGLNTVVLIFYPGDNTPVCTQQLCELRDNYTAFTEKGAVIFGINPAGAKSHQAFAQKNEFPFLLLIDQDKKTSKSYGTDSKLMQKRTVYVIDKKGKIVFAQRGKPPVEEILKSFE
jgi:peroxiredoxin Q/BCP